MGVDYSTLRENYMSDNNVGLNNEEYVALNVHIPCELKDKLKFCSYKEKKSIKDLVREALEQYLLDNGG